MAKVQRGLRAMSDAGDACRVVRPADRRLCEAVIANNLALGEVLTGGERTSSDAVVARVAPGPRYVRANLTEEFADAVESGSVVVKMMAINTPQTTFVDLVQTLELMLNEAVAGNVIHDKIICTGLSPHFSAVYDTVVCHDVYGLFVSQNVTRVLYVFMEDAGPSLKSLLEVTDTDTDFLAAMLYQTISALFMAYETVGFVHYDLHAENVRLKRLPVPVQSNGFAYEIVTRPRGQEQIYYVSIPSNVHCGYVAKIIDYGRCRVHADPGAVRAVFGRMCGRDGANVLTERELAKTISNFADYDEFGIPTNPKSANIMRDVHQLSIDIIRARAKIPDFTRSNLSDAIDALAPYAFDECPVLPSLLHCASSRPDFLPIVVGIFQYFRESAQAYSNPDSAKHPAAASSAPYGQYFWAKRQTLRAGYTDCASASAVDNDPRLHGLFSMMMTAAALVVGKHGPKFIQAGSVGDSFDPRVADGTDALFEDAVIARRVMRDEYRSDLSADTATKYPVQSLLNAFGIFEWSREHEGAAINPHRIIAAKSIIMRKDYSVASLVETFCGQSPDRRRYNVTDPLGLPQLGAFVDVLCDSVTRFLTWSLSTPKALVLRNLFTCFTIKCTNFVKILMEDAELETILHQHNIPRDLRRISLRHLLVAARVQSSGATPKPLFFHTYANAAPALRSTFASAAAHVGALEPSDTLPGRPVFTCVVCACSDTTRLSACSRCCRVLYCSRDHQLLHWNTHKTSCSPYSHSSL